MECLDLLYLNGYTGKLTTGLGLVFFMRDQLGKPTPSPAVLYQFRQLNGVPTIDYHTEAIFLLDCLPERCGFSSNI